MDLGIAVLLRQAEVDDVNEVALLAETHQEIVGLYISMNEIFRVYVFYATYLQRKQKIQNYNSAILS